MSELSICLHQAHPGKIQLCIALIGYKTNLKIPRTGLCTTWLASLPIGTFIPPNISEYDRIMDLIG